MIKLREILAPSSILGGVKSVDKKGVLTEFSEMAGRSLDLPQDEILNVLLGREKLGSTAVGNGVAIPHGKLAHLNKMVAFFGRSQEGVDFQAHDQKPVQLFFVILAPDSSVGNYLHALARLSRLVKEDRVRDLLLTVPEEELYNTLLAEDDKL